MDAEELGLVGPAARRTIAGANRELAEAGNTVFAGILGVDPLALGEAEAPSRHGHDLVRAAANEDLDLAGLGVVMRVMRETREVEVAAKLAIDPLEEVEVEGRGHAARIVIGRIDDLWILLQIDADQHRPVLSDDAAAAREELDRERRLQIADSRAGEK